MRPIEKIWCTFGFTVAWIGIWLTGPENPTDVYGTSDYIVFFSVLVMLVVALVKFYSQLVQQRMSEEMKRKLRRRDSRPNR